MAKDWTIRMSPATPRERRKAHTWTACLLLDTLPRQFSAPAFGTEGNEKPSPFRFQNFAETDANFYKDTRIAERVNLQLRFEFSNIFNRTNLTNFDQNLPDANFGKAQGQKFPRSWEVGAQPSFW